MARGEDSPKLLLWPREIIYGLAQILGLTSRTRHRVLTNRLYNLREVVVKNLARQGVATLAVGSLMCVGLLAIQAQPASAYQTDGLMLYLNASNTTSYNGGTAWNDLSGNNRNGTLMGPVVYDATTESLQFPGGVNGTAYVNLAGEFSDFSSGVTVEFEGEFGSTRAVWERIFDFGIPGGGGEANDLWVGHLADTNELAIETWHDGVNQGRCHTSTSGMALGPLDSRDFA